MQKYITWPNPNFTTTMKCHKKYNFQCMKLNEVKYNTLGNRFLKKRGQNGGGLNRFEGGAREQTKDQPHTPLFFRQAETMKEGRGRKGGWVIMLLRTMPKGLVPCYDTTMPTGWRRTRQLGQVVRTFTLTWHNMTLSLLASCHVPTATRVLTACIGSKFENTFPRVQM